MRKLIFAVLRHVWQSIALGSALLAMTAWFSYHAFLFMSGVTAMYGEPRLLAPALTTSFWPNLYLAEGIFLAATAIFATYFMVSVTSEEVRVVRNNLRWEEERRRELRLMHQLNNPYSGAVGYEGT